MSILLSVWHRFVRRRRRPSLHYTEIAAIIARLANEAAQLRALVNERHAARDQLETESRIRRSMEEENAGLRAFALKVLTGDGTHAVDDPIYTDILRRLDPEKYERALHCTPSPSPPMSRNRQDRSMCASFESSRNRAHFVKRVECCPE